MPTGEPCPSPQPLVLCNRVGALRLTINSVVLPKLLFHCIHQYRVDLDTDVQLKYIPRRPLSMRNGCFYFIITYEAKLLPLLRRRKKYLFHFLDLEISKTLQLCQKQVNIKRQLRYLIPLNKHPTHQRLL